MSDSSGNLVDSYTYGPYGETTDPTGNPFRYTGRRIDPETGLYYYRARYMSPSIGRFLQTDPIGYGDNMNMYAYVGNDPINANDPMGLCKVVDGELTECEIIRNETEDQEAAVDDFIATLVEIGEAIYESGDQDLIDAFESIDVIVFSDQNSSPKGDAATASRAVGADAVEKGIGTDILTVYGDGYTPSGNWTTSLAGHEIEHFTQRNRNLSRMAGSLEGRSESSADRTSIPWLQSMGLLPSPYTSVSAYTAGEVFGKN